MVPRLNDFTLQRVAVRATTVSELPANAALVHVVLSPVVPASSVVPGHVQTCAKSVPVMNVSSRPMFLAPGAATGAAIAEPFVTWKVRSSSIGTAPSALSAIGGSAFGFFTSFNRVTRGRVDTGIAVSLRLVVYAAARS